MHQIAYLVVVSSSFTKVGNNNQKHVLHIMYIFITLFFSLTNTSTVIVFIIYQITVEVFFVVVAMNIDIFKLFLPWNLIKIHLKMYQIALFSKFSGVACPRTLYHSFRRSMHRAKHKAKNNDKKSWPPPTQILYTLCIGATFPSSAGGNFSYWGRPLFKNTGEYDKWK